MTLEELQKIFPNATAENLAELSKGFATVSQTPPIPPAATPPAPTEIKADTPITMTAAEIMQLLSSLDKSKKLDEENKEKEKFDDRIFV